MKFRAIGCCGGLLLGLLAGLHVTTAAAACGGDDCTAAVPQKPLDVMKFMREQAASTRASEAHSIRKPKRPAAQAHTPKLRAPHSAVARRHPEKPLPNTAAASFAAEPSPASSPPPAPEVEVVTVDEFNSIDRAAADVPPPAPLPETVGTATKAEPGLQLVVAQDFDDIDRKTEQVPSSAIASAVPPDKAEVAAPTSWVQWLWSGVVGTFAALRTLF